MVSSMNISGIRPAAGIYDYKITKDRELEEVTTLDAGQGPELQKQEYQKNNSQTETAFSHTQKYEPDKTYEMKGAQSSLEDLDMEQAISDMQKDRLLQQYQFFVGSSRQTQDPAVSEETYPYENFDI